MQERFDCTSERPLVAGLDMCVRDLLPCRVAVSAQSRADGETVLLQHRPARSHYHLAARQRPFPVLLAYLDRRRSICLHLPVAGGKWHTDSHGPDSSAAPCNSSLLERRRFLLRRVSGISCTTWGTSRCAAGGRADRDQHLGGRGSCRRSVNVGRWAGRSSRIVCRSSLTSGLGTLVYNPRGKSKGRAEIAGASVRPTAGVIPAPDRQCLAGRIGHLVRGCIGCCFLGSMLGGTGLRLSCATSSGRAASKSMLDRFCELGRYVALAGASIGPWHCLGPASAAGTGSRALPEDRRNPLSNRSPQSPAQARISLWQMCRRYLTTAERRNRRYALAAPVYVAAPAALLPERLLHSGWDGRAIRNRTAAMAALQ